MKNYVYRRKLTRRELFPAIGAGAAVGLGVAVLVGYVTQIFLRRAPLAPERGAVAAAAENPDRDHGLAPRLRGDDERGGGKGAATLLREPRSAAADGVAG